MDILVSKLPDSSCEDPVVSSKGAFLALFYSQYLPLAFTKIVFAIKALCMLMVLKQSNTLNDPRLPSTRFQLILMKIGSSKLLEMRSSICPQWLFLPLNRLISSAKHIAKWKYYDLKKGRSWIRSTLLKLTGILVRKLKFLLLVT